MLPLKPRRSPRQQQQQQQQMTRRSLGGGLSLLPGTPSRKGDNTPLQPSPLRNELASASKTKSRKRARSLGGSGGEDPTAPSSLKQINPRKKRMTIVI